MRKIKGLRWYMIALVTLGTVLGYLTRNTVAAAAPTLMEELHISTQQYSYIIAAYSAAYTVMQPVAGMSLIFWGPKLAMPSSPSPGGILRLNGAGRQLGWTGAGPWRSRRSGSRNDPRRPEGQLRVVPGKRALYRGGLLQRGFLYWRHDRAAVGGVGDCHAQLADGVHHLRGIELRLGHRRLIFYKHPRDQKNYLTKNVTTSLAVRSLSIRPITRRKCRRGKSCATVSSGVSPCRASSPSRPGGPLTPGSRCSCSKFTVLT